MADQHTHKVLTNRNTRTLERFRVACPDQDDDAWFVIIAYFIAHHYVEALAAREGVHHASHADCCDFIARRNISAKKCFDCLFAFAQYELSGELDRDNLFVGKVNRTDSCHFRKAIQSWLSVVTKL